MMPLDRAAVFVLISLVIAFGRFTVPGHSLSYPGAYEAFAHIWVGALIVLAVRAGWRVSVPLVALVLLTVLEGAMFALR
jgi:hypothetical protein